VVLTRKVKKLLVDRILSHYCGGVVSVLNVRFQKTRKKPMKKTIEMIATSIMFANRQFLAENPSFPQETKYVTSGKHLDPVTGKMVGIVVATPQVPLVCEMTMPLMVEYYQAVRNLETKKEATQVCSEQGGRMAVFNVSNEERAWAVKVTKLPPYIQKAVHRHTEAMNVDALERIYDVMGDEPDVFTESHRADLRKQIDLLKATLDK
jgi:hypothetical protein